MNSSIKADIPASNQGLGSFRETSTSSPPYTAVVGDPPLGELDARGPMHAEFKGREPWHSGDSYRYPVPKKGDPWEHCHALVQRYDGGRHDAWKDEIDKLLIFAGLFSATVTAFTIESYQWLEEGSSDATARLLADIVIQLKQLSPDRNDTMVPISDSCSAPFVLSSTVVRINIFWFLSLTLSLSTVLVGILCMQWLHEYHRDTALPHKDAIALRQMRYEGFLKWKVPAILSSLPLLLQSAVILFFAGLLELLWTLNKIVAASVTVAVSVAVLFLAVTTAAPFLQFVLLGERDFQAGQCAYKSPQSWAFYRLGLCTLWLMTRDVNPTSWIKWSAFSLVKLRRSLHDQSWLEYDINQWRRLRNADDLVKGLAWVDRSFTRSLDAVYSLYHCLQDIDMPTAAQVISELNPDVTVTQRLQQVVEDPVMQIAYKRDNVIASFLEMHRRTHPSLGSFYLETIVRLSNTQDTVRPFMDWPVRDLLTFPNGMQNDDPC